VGGLVIQNADPFDDPFGTYWGFSVIPTAIDSIEQAIGVYEHMKSEASVESASLKSKAQLDIQMVRNYAFVAMPMDSNNPELDDVLDAIKEGAARCGIQAERIDEPASNERITDRILESIRKAEYVIVDLTHVKPNVYYEAGYAHGLGKIPIYLAKEGTKLEFDLKDSVVENDTKRRSPLV
jgi:nucleoside 2-deoxyribosyltransferase